MAALIVLLAALGAAAGGGPRVRWRRAARPAGLELVPGGREEPGAGRQQDDAGLVWGPELEADTGAWRELWAGALAALRREPALNDTQDTVTAQLGQPAFLHCPVRHLGERRVSWVRRRDWHILSSGLSMYTSDERFQVLHSEGSDDWVLQIKFVQQRDDGSYECQVAGARGALARRVQLAVAAPEAFILGGAEHHVDAGSTLSLVCIVEKSPVPPQYVFWYHNARMINYDVSRGVSVRTERGPKTQSTLAVRRAAPAHSGNYTCRAAGAAPAHILVYVQEGSDKMAATLRRNSAVPPPPRPRRAAPTTAAAAAGRALSRATPSGQRSSCSAIVSGYCTTVLKCSSEADDSRQSSERPGPVLVHLRVECSKLPIM